jgi:cardiolipin synthase A/B
MSAMQWLWWALGTTALLAALAASGHALVYKRDPRSATLWLVVIWLVPMFGWALYLLLGINRVRRKAFAVREPVSRRRAGGGNRKPATPAGALPDGLDGLQSLARRITRQELVAGNAIQPLVNGVAAFPAMLASIDSAQTSIMLSSYIFDRAGIGADFVAALARARQRGVEARVLIDDVYVRLARSSAFKPLLHAGVPVAAFNSPLIPARLHAINLRNHRKLLVVDGRSGFTGGMNIHEPYWRPDDPDSAERDLHFKLEGPVVRQLAEVFVADWLFTTGEELQGEAWLPEPEVAGPVPARGIEEGPDEHLDRLRWVFIGALHAARQHIGIWTPYFVPDQAIIAALNAAALRGVTVDILLPERSDHRIVDWAAQAHFWQVLEHGCRIWVRGGPFDHTKLFVVDGTWCCFGSANWDARSLRLNFEFNVEAYGADLGGQLEALFTAALAQARPVTLAEVNARPLPAKLRDGTARLFTPFL